MSYQWGPQGPAFETEGIYRVENRVLLVRAALLVLLAFVILTLTLSDLSVPRGLQTKLLRLPQDGSTRHLLFGLLLLALAVKDVVRMARQRVLRLQPGQPGPLVAPVRTANTANPEAAALHALFNAAPVPAPAAPVAWSALLLPLARQAGALPHAVQVWLAQRLSHLVLLGGLALTLGLAWVLLPPVGVVPVGGLCILAVGLMQLRSLNAERAPMGAGLVALLLAAVLLVGLGTGWLLGHGATPASGGWLSSGLPQGALLLLAALLPAELLALRAGLVRTDVPLARGPQPALRSVQIQADPESVAQELERELHHYWNEGVPNRRYIWQTNQADYKKTGAAFAFESLEETQPVMAAATAGHGGRRRALLLLLMVLALVLTLAGGLLWGSMIYAQLQRAERPFTWAVAAVLLVLSGGQVLRMAHLLWSRVEAESLLLSLQCSAGADAAAPIRLQWAVLRARSAFYAAADHRAGSRMLLALASDAATAQRSVEQVQRYAEKVNANAADGADPRMNTPAPRAARPSAPAPRAAAPVAAGGAPAAPPKPPAGVRYCLDCGEAMPVAARFCPRCGERQRGV